jgi:hypothetical protein
MNSYAWKLKKKALGFCAHCCQNKAGEQIGNLVGTGVLCGMCAEIHRQRNLVGRRRKGIPIRKAAPRYKRKYAFENTARLEKMLVLQAKMDVLQKNLDSIGVQP